ncbi:MAG: nucleoside deaminase [Nanoarchaeota archaeon]|nr:nucleoside deaminase [Nanoarchaeota archaeon]
MSFSKKDREIMSLAINEAREAGKQGNFPIGSVLTINEDVVAVGKNQLYINGDWYSHAENRLIEKHSKSILEEKKRGSSIELYSTLEPCFMCFGTSLLHRIPKITFGCPDPYGGVAGMDKKNFPPFYRERWPKIRSGLFAKESCDLLLNFFASKDTPEFREMFNTYKNLKIE